MRNAYCLIREQPVYRADAFRKGLKRAGFRVLTDWPVLANVKRTDVLVIWNRYDNWHRLACQFEAIGATVLVAENGYLGREWRGGHWYALSRNWHNGRGTWSPEGPGRWESMGVDLGRIGPTDGYVLLLPQRGFGPPECAMPADWIRRQQRLLANTKLREHPGNGPERVPLGEDLAGCRYAVTHGSGAGIKAMAMGYPVVSTWPEWIGYPAQGQVLGEERRWHMFCRLAYAMWSVEELATGGPFARLANG